MFLHLRCAVLEKGGKLPLSLLSLSKGSWTAFPLWKVCTVKKGQSKTLQGQGVCSEWPPICPLTVTSHSRTLVPLTAAQSTPEFLCNQSMRNWKCTAQGRIWLPARLQVKIQPFPKCQMGWTLPNTGHALGSLGRHWAGCDSASVLGSTCTWGMCGTHRDSSPYQDKLKEKGELNKAQFPEIWTEKAVSHWRSTSTRMLLLMIDNCIQGLRLVIKTQFWVIPQTFIK